MSSGSRLVRAVFSALAVMLLSGCEGSAPSRAAVHPAPPLPQLARGADGSELMALAPSAVPGMTFAVVKRVELPAALETTGQVAFDDRRVATIISRVSGRIEDSKVSQWDQVKRGEEIVRLYSPDYMTAEAEYLQAQTTAKLSSNSGLGEGAKFANC